MLHRDTKVPIDIKKAMATKASPSETGAADTSRVVRSQAVARSHNVFRPDIYRVSEGYLN